MAYDLELGTSPLETKIKERIIEIETNDVSKHSDRISFLLREGKEDEANEYLILNTVFNKSKK